jgi:Delta3-Delta2-enoyl-CoA isomerase
MTIIEYELDERIAIVTLNCGENRFNPDFLTAFMDILDELEQQTDARTIIVKSAHEKIWSNGIDLEWIVPIIQKGDIETAKTFFFQLNALFKKILTCPMITIAAITGHAFAGGAIISCAFDFRFMRSDRGFFCFPEVDLGIPFLPGMNELLKKAMPMYMVEQMEYTGKRLTAEECQTHHIISKAVHLDNLMTETLNFAKTLNKERAIIGEMKQRLNSHIVRKLEGEDVDYIQAGKFNIG